MALTVMDCVNAVRNGNFEEIPQEKEERIIVLNSQLMANYSLILAHCLLNNVPNDGTGEALELRATMFDEIIQVVNLNNYGRANKIVGELETICSKYDNESKMWPSKKERNNIMLFIPQYIIWDDNTRYKFFGGDEEDNEQGAPVEAADVDVNDVQVE